MESRNPIFGRKDAFRSTVPPASAEQLNEMYNAPSYAGPAQGTRRMTLDDVVVRTAMTLGVLTIVACVAWALIDIQSPALFPMFMGAALVGLGLGLFMSFKHVTNPGVILTYAAVEGVFIGLATKVIVYFVGNGNTGIVMQAVLGTLGAAGVMLALYKYEIIKVTQRFAKVVIAATAGFFLVTMISWVLGMLGVLNAENSPNGFGTIGLIASFVGAALASFCLMLDFEAVKQGIAQGADEKEAWFCAFGLTVSLVWLYLEILRIVAIFSRD